MIMKLNKHFYMKQYKGIKKTKISYLWKEEKLKKIEENRLRSQTMKS